MLNQMSLGLSSTLEVKPLLQRILLSALEILGCQAGVLFLVDQQTGVLDVEAASGFVRDGLAARRFLPDACLAGAVAQQAKPILANNLGASRQLRDPIFLEPVATIIKDTLAAPMRYQDRVVGVIEVINKINGLSFDLSDQELLVTYTYQAATALENARLYSMTDQALSARVEELSVMQQIDRELNTTLDVQTALQKTLAWAMRQSHADAGLAGAVEIQDLAVITLKNMTTLGSSTACSETKKADYSLQEFPELHSALNTGRAQTASTEIREAPVPPILLPQMKSRAVVPLCRESSTIGLIILESDQQDGFPPDVLEFLGRLGDHAAIALANAQLYQEVIEANLAKSKFVNFVAHELKNPMASIKGYADILAGGMAGPVNEMQSGFLATVRANVDRMNVIISDLNDQTKIQAGNLRLELRSVALCDVVDEVIYSLNPQILEKNLRLSKKILVESPQVWANSLRLAQVLTNLISNAAKYTNPGGEVIVGVDRIPRTVRPSSRDEVHIWVQDNGIGISAEDQGKIFAEYFRTEESRAMAPGTGLGLNITQSLVTMQGGEIWFESEPGKGTVFHFTLPAA